MPSITTATVLGLIPRCASCSKWPPFQVSPHTIHLSRGRETDLKPTSMMTALVHLLQGVLTAFMLDWKLQEDRVQSGLLFTLSLVLVEFLNINVQTLGQAFIIASGLAPKPPFSGLPLNLLCVRCVGAKLVLSILTAIPLPVVFLCPSSPTLKLCFPFNT